MKKVGNVDIPQEAFMTVLSVDDDDKQEMIKNEYISI